MLDLNRLRCLHAVSLSGSVGGASRALHLSPSAVSQQLSKLEGEVGRRLLEPAGRGVRLTATGVLLAEHAERLLAALAQAEAELEATEVAVRGLVRVGAFPTAARGLVPGALVSVGARHPALGVRLEELDLAAGVARLAQGALDVMVAQDWVNAPLVLPAGLERQALLEDQADLLVPASHPLARRERASVRALADEPWIAEQAGTICHDWLLLTLRANGWSPRLAHTASEHQTIVALVAAGLGLAVVPRLGRGPLPLGVKAVAVDPPLTRQVYALWRRVDRRRPAVRVLVEALAAEARQAPRPKAAGPSRARRVVASSRRAARPPEGAR